MRHEDVRARLGHRVRLLDREHVRRGEEVLLAGEADHVDLEPVAHARLLEVLPDRAVEQADGGEVLDAAEAEPLELVEEDVHQAERVGAAHAREHRRLAATIGSTSRAMSTTIAFASPYGSRPESEPRPAIR